jgi:ATP-dependent helicase STH1/SNF2
VLRALSARHRLLLSGTPLQNNLRELWALLNFVLPRLFDSSSNFEEWFATPFGGLGSAGAGGGATAAAAAAAAAALALSPAEEAAIVARLHAVLRPFLLRRLKSDVALALPARREVLLRCPMSALQAALYEAARRRAREAFALAQGGGGTAGTPRGGGEGSLAAPEGGGGGGGAGALPRAPTLSNLFVRLRQICNHPALLAES